MNIMFLAKGLVIGFSIAAPVGPIGILCIRRSLTQGKIVGLLSGLGAATADAIYGFMAGFGLTAISSLLLGQQTLLRILGGLFLCYLGLKIFRDKPANESAQINHKLGAYASTFLLTLTNPMTILGFIGIFSGLGLGETNNYFDATLLVLGVFLGSALWWLLLVGFIELFRDRLNSTIFQWVNRVSGLIIISFGILAIATVIWQ
ncbi:MAG: LysE family transporter [Limnospira sp. PMC 1291.21]|uniref:LysE family transporter n=1 Tax=Limnospira fusiformis PMC 851.14 TaxID=2219512 RepID=A0ABU9ENS9_LIMFS|nr:MULTISPECIES: LysE family transporter [Limnospira]RAQ41483.1 lysine transporter LysE [Arthrospira sp. O9.13F]MDT9179221.1 LysE family transporter [Limnospira sp. PMC 1238.20]MDT9188723.1 LysE family transporter [Limnospira sp. PMC 894.15]MDT9193822.1 LysE family transporter [Limnospira sp. PMC 1245.20]MDT9198966.1 LysE family transporter [Limnospira sp. PMC 1042.18]